MDRPPWSPAAMAFVEEQNRSPAIRDCKASGHERWLDCIQLQGDSGLGMQNFASTLHIF